MEHKDKQIVELESEIRYLRQLLDENGIKYDYKEYDTFVSKIQYSLYNVIDSV